MFHDQSREQLRATFFDVKKKMAAQEILSPLEKQIADVIDWHPEYHSILDDKEQFIDKDFFPEMGEVNPFLHLSLHLGLREQIATNRPKGIASLYQKALRRFSMPHDAEHCLMDAIAEGMWQSQSSQRPMDDTTYLKLLKKYLKKAGVR